MLARSFNQASRLVSVTVTLGGGLNVLGAVHLARPWRLSSTCVNMWDSVCRAMLFFWLKFGQMLCRALLLSF